MTYTIIARIETATGTICPPAIKGIKEHKISDWREGFRAMAREQIGSTCEIHVTPDYVIPGN